MSNYYVTIFDQNYVVRSLTLYRSMQRHLDGHRFAFFCVDHESAELLGKLDLPHAWIVPPDAYETPLLARLKRERERGPYCWTLKPVALEFGRAHFADADWLVYIDTDMMAFADPADALPGDPAANVFLTPHRFNTEAFLRYTATSGRYNAGFAAFRNAEAGHAPLAWWHELCLEDCTVDPDTGRCGDQLYLDRMGDVFPGVVDSDDKGVNAAPWNISGYRIERRGDEVFLDGEPLYLYHFQGLRIFAGSWFDMYAGHLNIPRPARTAIYRPYLRGISNSFRELRRADGAFRRGAEPLLSRRTIIDTIRQHLDGVFNFVRQS